ncbi:protein kinase domain-containing protein [Streptomyces aidingensis]|uniref:non-specific serine/threonine protein kinase n=1 Tax=Streptomyces aidingensis TaxID=910347 RepID=A0A1I1K0L9_9ACTN|nr:protein kinase [Streptomyces aidingensis]SFC53752.1 serine/threonine protein kinase [Streptomyces aidingensis]
MTQERDGSAPGEEESPGRGSGASPDSPEGFGINGRVGEGRYRLTHRLGRGGMAEVFGAEDVRLGRQVAVKLLRPDLAEDAVAKARFTREAQSVAGLNHHAVVAVYDSGEELDAGGNAVPYIVMELISGRTVREVLHSGDPADSATPERALAIVSGVLEALAYSHQHGIVHRDIKPANVIITDTGSIKVMDFGIARALHAAQQTMTQTGMVMGTPQYLSPEQALGKAVDTRSDLYAVGCLLYELLTGRPPFVGETPLAVVYQHVQDTPRVPSETAPSAPPELDGLVMRSLAKDPDDRFQSAEEMRALVQYALRMLEQHGGHTGGLWNTGSVNADTPAMGTPGVPATAATTVLGATGRMPHGPVVSGPVGLGMAPGAPDGTGGGDRGRGSRRGVVLLAALAVIAVLAGVLVVLSPGGGDGGATRREPDNTTPPPTAEETSGAEEDEVAETEEPPDEDGPFGPSTPEWTEPAPEQETTAPEETTGSTEPGETEGADGETTDGSATTEGETGDTTDGATTGDTGGADGETTDGSATEGETGDTTDGATAGDTGGETTEGAGGGDTEGGGSTTAGSTTDGSTTTGEGSGGTTDGVG